MGHERREQVPHPLAGQTGEGAPFAPPNWIWKAGQRLSDMYFCSPEGRRVRSQIQLQDYLSSIPNPPPFSQFCWRVTPEGKASWRFCFLPSSSSSSKLQLRNPSFFACCCWVAPAATEFVADLQCLNPNLESPGS